MSDTTTMRIDRLDMPAVPPPTGELIDQWDIYATVSLRGTTATIERFAYWHANDGEAAPSVLFEARINGLPETCGTADIVAAQPRTLCDLAAVCAQAAYLLTEARSLHGNRIAVVGV
jgi:hypothetical protein